MGLSEIAREEGEREREREEREKERKRRNRKVASRCARLHLAILANG